MAERRSLVIVFDLQQQIYELFNSMIHIQVEQR